MIHTSHIAPPENFSKKKKRWLTTIAANYKVKVRLKNTSSHAVSSVYLVAGAGQKTCSFYI